MLSVSATSLLVIWLALDPAAAPSTAPATAPKAAATTTVPTMPVKKVQAPGFRRVKLGQMEVVALLDGTIDLPVEQLLHGIKPKQVEAALAQGFQSTPVETSVNAFLVDTGSKRILIDTGAAALYGPGLGKIVANLAAAGYKPDSIDEIYITHLHGDHVGGLSAGDKPVFPNATVRLDKHEADYWLSADNLAKAAADEKSNFTNAQTALAPYLRAGKVQPFEGDTTFFPGISARVTHGHTPGHTSYVAESEGQKMVFIGDLIHVAAVQFGKPKITISFDADEKAAGMQRKQMFKELAKNESWIAGPHLSFPGIGHIRASGAGYVWYPLPYSDL